MKTIYDNKYLRFDLDTEKSIFMYTWKATSEEITLEELFVEGKRILEAVLQSKVRSFISHDTDFKFPLIPEVQVEINKSILTHLNNSTIKKFAHVNSTEIITQLSVEQFFDENVNKTYEDKYFDNLEDAINWCKL